MAGLKVVLVLVTVLAVAYGLPTGATITACDNLRPGHNGSVQTTEVPYTFNLSEFMTSNGSGYEYNPEQTYLLTLRDFDNDTNTFRGFFVQSRTVADGSRVGTFGVFNPNASQIGPCSPTNSSITHTDNTDKSLMKMYWTAPPMGTGAIQFAYAMVQTYLVYWANETSKIINEAVTSPTTTPTTSPTAAPTVTPTDCSDLMCDTGEMCVLRYGMPVCVCQDMYVYNPNSMACEKGNLTLPILLNPTEVPTVGMCPEIDTSDSRNMIQNVVQKTIIKNQLASLYSD